MKLDFMKLSKLQKYILLEAYATKDKLLRGKLLDYYKTKKNKKKKPNKKDQINIIHRSINRLIDRGLMIGYGKRTREKWFYTFIRLSPQGKATAKKIFLDKQQKLPLKK